MTPSDVANEAIDSIGWPSVLGDIQDGSHEASIVLRHYGQCLRQMLRCCHWDFARKQAPLQLLGDATGNTPLVRTVVQRPWIYCYALPPDSAKVRFIPLNHENPSMQIADNTFIPATPLVTGLGEFNQYGRTLQPARFLVGMDVNYPVPAGDESWETPGVSPVGRVVIMTNVRNAYLVYTMQTLYPSMWDSLFRAAFVAYLAAEIALPLWAKTDRKFGLEMRNAQVGIVKAKVVEARATNGNEGSLSSSDIRVDWMDGRRAGGGQWTGMGGMGFGNGEDGVYGYGYDSIAVPNGSVF